jgi:hypothetical protein
MATAQDPRMASATNPDVSETLTLISSDKVQGTDVRRPNGDKIGEIKHLMIEKRSGKVVYAVMSFGGFLGIGEDYYPIPWEKLTYNTELDAYEIDITEDQLANAPKLASTGQYDWSQEQSRRVSDYYGTTSNL